MAFPGPHARIIYNEAGEPLGWENPSEDDGAPPYCDVCGYNHPGPCDWGWDGEDDDE